MVITFFSTVDERVCVSVFIDMYGMLFVKSREILNVQLNKTPQGERFCATSTQVRRRTPARLSEVSLCFPTATRVTVMLISNMFSEFCYLWAWFSKDHMTTTFSCLSSLLSIILWYSFTLSNVGSQSVLWLYIILLCRHSNLFIHFPGHLNCSWLGATIN